ncbi:MAG: nucleoside deaminase [Bacilli bacterium]|nr:nucleoside deaminase [Bacilli bacterium]
MNKDIEYIKRAINLSKKGTYPYGAVIVKDNIVIAEAYSGEGDNLDPTNHAETLAVRKACKNIGSSDLKGATIYSSCEPCFMCFGTIWWANISKIVYAANIEESNKVLNTPIDIGVEELNNKTGNCIKITGGILEEESVKVMEEWLKNKEKI